MKKIFYVTSILCFKTIKSYCVSNSDFYQPWGSCSTSYHHGWTELALGTESVTGINIFKSTSTGCLSGIKISSASGSIT